MGVAAEVDGNTASSRIKLQTQQLPQRYALCRRIHCLRQRNKVCCSCPFNKTTFDTS